MLKRDVLKKSNAVFFDIGWVICRPASREWMLTNKFWEIADKDEANRTKLDRITLTQKRRVLKKGYQYLIDNHHLLTIEDELNQFIQFYSIVIDDLELNVSKEDIYQIAHDRVYNMDNYQVFDGVAETFKQLSKNYYLGIIANAYPSARLLLDKIGILKYLDVITLSCELGAIKPSVRVCEDALMKIMLSPQNTVLVDSEEESIQVCQKLGMKGIQKRKSGIRPKDDIIRISHLDELSQLIPAILSN